MNDAALLFENIEQFELEIKAKREHVARDPTLFLCPEKNIHSETEKKLSGENLSKQVPEVPNVPINDINLSLAVDATEEAEPERAEAIKKARSILDDIIYRCKDEPGLLASDTFIDAAALIKQDSALWFEYRDRIKKAKPSGVPLSDIESLINGDSEGTGREAETTASELIELVMSRGTLFYDSQADKAFVEIDKEGVRLVYAIGGKDFTKWLSFAYYTETKAISKNGRGKSASEAALKQASMALAGIAEHDGEIKVVSLRVAVSPRKDRRYIFMADASWRMIEVTANGWQILNQSPVKFWRSSSMQPLPEPMRGGDLSKLWQFVNIPKNDRFLVLAWLLECWRPEAPFPVLSLSGQQGSAKSSTQSRLRELVDNNAVNLRAAPKSVEDIFVSAGCNWLSSFENISHLTPNMQDALCTLATGGGFSTRTFYTNSEETIIEVKRPIVINSIPHVVTAQDLTDRAICIECPKIEYREESEIKTEWDSAKGEILGGLLDLFSKTLAKLPEAKGDTSVRMADFVRFGEAMALALGEAPGTFTSLYKANRAANVATALESSPVGVAVRELADAHDRRLGNKVFYGTLKQLYDKLSMTYKHSSNGWPQSPKGLSEAIKRQVPALSALGVEIEQSTSREYIDGQRGLAIKISLVDGNVGNNGNLVSKNPPRKKNLSDADDMEVFG